MGLALVLTPNLVAAKTHHHKVHHATPVDGSATYSDIVIDAETGRILHATSPDSLRHPASLTKMMTLYVTFQALETGHLRLDQTLPVSQNAAEQSPSKLGLRPGQRIRVGDAILGLVTESANDAAVVLGEALGGSETGFGRLMTQQAHALGMVRTRFDNPSGLPDPDQVTTARDMAMLGHALIYHYPEFYPYFNTESFTYGGIYHHNHNHLKDRYAGMDGIKTGYIRASGFNLVASAKRSNTRLIGVVFGGHSATARDNHMAELLDEAFVVSRQEKTSAHMASESEDGAQGDTTDGGPQESAEYVALPPKISAVYASSTGETVTTSVAKMAVVQVPTSQLNNAETESAMLNAAAMNGAQPAPQPHFQEDGLVAEAQGASAPQPKPESPQALTIEKWGIQIGAYSDAALGRRSLTRVAASLPRYLGQADALIQPVTNAGVTTYRARLMGINQRTARSVCTYLLQHGQSCMIVEP